MEKTIRTSILSAFCADALALGVHWVYDANAIREKYGRLTEMTAPELADYHQGKPQGAFTHYGDQAMVLLKVLSQEQIFELKPFGLEWQNLFSDYGGYMDHASKTTLANFEKGLSPEIAGAPSMDLGGASRMFPLGLMLSRGMERSDFVRACMDQTRMTHNTPQVLGAARLMAETYARVVEGMGPVAALNDTLTRPDLPLDVTALVKTALRSRDQDSLTAIQTFGAACSWDGALAGTIHLLAKYENDLEAALVENIMAGGDSAARGMLVGWLLGAHVPEQLPGRWVDGMVRQSEIQVMLGD